MSSFGLDVGLFPARILYLKLFISQNAMYFSLPQILTIISHVSLPYVR